MSRTVVSTARGWMATGLLTAFVVATAATTATNTSMRSALAISLAVAAAGAGAVAASGTRTASCVLGVALACSLGVVRGAAAVPGGGAGAIDSHVGAGPLTLTGTVRQGVAPAPADRLIVDAGELATGDFQEPVSGAVLIQLPPGTTVGYGPGDSVQVAARRLTRPGRRPGPLSADALRRQGVAVIATGATVSVLSVGGPNLASVLAAARGRLGAAVDTALPEPAATLLLGIAFGLRRRLPADLTAQLQDAGLFHIVVVSGLKVIIVAGMVRAVATTRAWSRAQRSGVAAATVGGYVLISGAGPAAVRSAAMGVVALLSNRDGRRVDPLPLLCLIAAVMIAVDPHIWSDVGFQLSFLGTAGILLLAEPIARRLRGPRLLVEPFAVTIAAQVATFPVMAGTFGVLSLIGPAANAVVLPLLPVLIVLGASGAAITIASPLLGWIPLHLAGAGVDAIVLAGRSAAALPGAAIHLGQWPPLWTVAELAGLAAAATVLISGGLAGRGSPHGARRRITAIAVVCGVFAASAVLVIGSRPDGRLRVTVLDVGAAPAVLIRTGEGGLALVDGGPDPARLLTALGRVLPPTTHTLDLVVMTGGDRAAVAGLSGLPGHYAIRRVMAPDPLGPGGLAVVDGLRAAGAVATTLDSRAWHWSGTEWICMPLGDPAPGGPACVLGLAAPGGRALILGTAAPAEQEELPALYGDRLAADLLVTQPGAVSPAVVGAIHPRELAVPAAAAATKTTQETVPAPGARTGTDGDLEYVGGADGLRRR